MIRQLKRATTSLLVSRDGMGVNPADSLNTARHAGGMAIRQFKNLGDKSPARVYYRGMGRNGKPLADAVERLLLEYHLDPIWEKGSSVMCCGPVRGMALYFKLQVTMTHGHYLLTIVGRSLTKGHPKHQEDMGGKI
jgi:hypothetical protein